MSVRQSLLAILDRGPCYGYQLRAEFARRTGSTWPLNVGQIYNTLDRLERDGMVVRDDVDEHGHVYWRITDAGSAEAHAWLRAPVVRPRGTRDELAIKLALAATLPGADVATLIGAQRTASAERLRSLDDSADEQDGGAAPEDVARTLVHASMRFEAQAELQWLDHVEEQLARHPDHVLALELSSERPKRGRPAAAHGPEQVTD
ncbi:PadR family transcriptional regulator [Microbacterium sp. SLBN-146]|uniref:PadR family transcriptional regulator n=1 Tax=Microbacterium sp. SLBN-146 TaxID=2768457 RepID=UPI0011520684|nr:PadR family transcriptional regulator [Microbacterium sp. SLBN-146]TQJ32690.1 PadR family transcriptional regulator [Microbacterium sp. SLBN-146]